MGNPTICAADGCTRRLSRGNVSGYCIHHFRRLSAVERLVDIPRPTPPPPDEPAIDAKAVARLLGVSIKTVYRLVRSGALPHFRVNRRLRFRPFEVREWTRQRREAAGSRSSTHGSASQERKVDRRRLPARWTAGAAGQPGADAARGEGVRGQVAGRRLIDIDAVLERRPVH